jgi:hypothetical protein
MVVLPGRLRKIKTPAVDSRVQRLPPTQYGQRAPSSRSSRDGFGRLARAKELHELLALLGFNNIGGCNCKSRVARMNRWGAEADREHRLRNHRPFNDDEGEPC